MCSDIDLFMALLGKFILIAFSNIILSQVEGITCRAVTCIVSYLVSGSVSGVNHKTF